MVDGTATIAVVDVTGATAAEVVDETVGGGAAAGAGGEPEQAARATSRGIVLHDIRRFRTSS